MWTCSHSARASLPFSSSLRLYWPYHPASGCGTMMVFGDTFSYTLVFTDDFLSVPKPVAPHCWFDTDDFRSSEERILLDVDNLGGVFFFFFFFPCLSKMCAINSSLHRIKIKIKSYASERWQHVMNVGRVVFCCCCFLPTRNEPSNVAYTQQFVHEPWTSLYFLLLSREGDRDWRNWRNNDYRDCSIDLERSKNLSLSLANVAFHSRRSMRLRKRSGRAPVGGTRT